MIAKSSDLIRAWLFAVICSGTSATIWADTFSADAIRAAFQSCHSGYSSDELLIRDTLRDCFLHRLGDGEVLNHEQQRSALLTLLKLRKTGKLDVPVIKRGSPVAAAVHSVAEIASRVVTDRHRVTSDTMLADPELRVELQHEAELIAPGIDPYQVRKAVLSLRKKRALRPELVLQVVQWGREISTYTLQELESRLAEDTIPKRPGVYLFRNPEGYLYVGEAIDLSARLNQHVTESDRISLARYLAGDDAESVTVELHVFQSDSPAAKVSARRAYESELIRSRKPKFNVRP